MSTESKTTSATAKALLSGIVDYAGLFPPAKLSVKDAVSTFISHRKKEYSWMLGRFVVGSVKMRDVANEFVTQGFTEKVEFSMVSTYVDDKAGFLDGLTSQMNMIKQLEKEYQSQFKVPSFEVKLPSSLTKKMPSWAIYELMREVTEVVLEQAPDLNQIFFETDLSTDWKNAIPNTLDGIFRNRQVILQSAPHLVYGFKLRCGGVNPEDHPNIDLVAMALRFAKNAGIPLKFTAGLHHPFRHYDSSMKIRKHGFVNIFTTGILHSLHNLEDEEIQELIGEELSELFTFNQDTIAWKDYAADLTQISEARKNTVLSFGSCSFDEPVEDLVALGIL